uniref:Kazal-like domain-containing protein n=1 Tax=Plectus sambesii TaxID=2011161 RepID=A0A914W5P3_9BILA
MARVACFDNVRWFLWAFYLCYLFESSGFAYTIGTSRAVQVQLKRSSLSSGVLIAARDAGFVFSVLLLSLFGSRGNRAVWLGLACSIGALGNILIGLPSAYFSYRQSERRSNMNSTNSSDVENCVDSGYLMWTMLGGHGIFGFGHSTVWSLGVPLLDSLAQKLSNPLPLAMAFSMRIIGPIIGFLLSAVFNAIKLWHSESWWLGFIVLGLLQLLPSIWLTAFRKRATDSRLFAHDKSMKETKTEQPKKPDATSKAFRQQLMSNLQTSFFAIKLVISSNPVYVGSLIGRTLDAFAFKGAFVFVPLFMNIEFEQSSVATSLYYATIGMISFTVGIIGGGLLVSKFNHEGQKAALFIATCSFFCGVVTICQVWIPCDNLINRIGADFNHTNCLGETCPLITDPICDSLTGQSYASLCHAGCRLENETRSCACAPSGQASLEYCDSSSCRVASIVYMVCTMIIGVATGCAVVPGILVLLCAVPPQRRSVALGFSGLAVSLLGTMPSSLVFGYLIDSSCLLWSNEKCSGRGYCVSYDSSALRLRFYLTCGILRLCAMCTDLYVSRRAVGLRLTAETFEEPPASLSPLLDVVDANLHQRDRAPTAPGADNADLSRTGEETQLAHKTVRKFYEERPLNLAANHDVSVLNMGGSSMTSSSASLNSIIDTVSVV